MEAYAPDEAALRLDLLRFREAQKFLSDKKLQLLRLEQEIEVLQSVMDRDAGVLIDSLNDLGLLGAAVILSPRLAVTAWEPQEDDRPHLYLEFFEWSALQGWDDELHNVTPDDADRTVPFLQPIQ